MSTHDNIKLQPLPDIANYLHPRDREQIRQYARDAIAPYQQRIEELEAQLEAVGAGGVSGQPITSQRRGEPVAWLYEDELPDNYPYDTMFPYSKVDGVRMFPVYAPQPAEPVKAPGDGVRCNWCGWSGIEDDLVIETAADEPEEGPANVCPDCKRIGCLMDLGCDERAAQGLPPYTPRKPTEEEWARLTENGRKAWSGPVKAPSDSEIMSLAYDVGAMPEQMTDESLLKFARVLLARYGHPIEPEGWRLVPKEPTEEMLVDAMEASLLGRPSPDDDSYVRSIVKAWCAAAPKFGEEE